MIIMEKFSYESNGYNREEVNQFISDVITQTEDIVSRCQSQKDEIIALKKELKHYRNIEDNLKLAILRAEKTSEEIKKLAKDESEVIITEAKENASRIVNEALLRADRIEQSANLLEKNMEIFKKKLRLIVEQQLTVVDEIEVLQLEP